MAYANPARAREYQRAYQREWMRARRAQYMHGKSCASCGAIQDLEIDHLDPTQKTSHRIWSWSTERRNAELAKCQILCADCHLEKTWTIDRPTQGCGTTAKYRRGCRCADCRAANAAKARRQRERRREETR